MRIGIAGVSGRMGRLLVNEVAAIGATLSGGTTRPGAMVTPGAVPLFDQIDQLAAVSDVVIDFTQAAAVADHASALQNRGCGWILGTSGLSKQDEAVVAAAAQTIPIVYAANFSFGVTLMMMLAEQMARLLPAERYDAEILETHHRQKRDAPSGTAIGLSRAIASGRGQDPDVAIERFRRCPDRNDGPRGSGEIGFAALRGGQVVGDHTVLFLSDVDHLSLHHHAVDRRMFATGAVRAALWCQDQPAGLYSMRDVVQSQLES